MKSKQFQFDTDVRKSFLAGIDKLAKAVRTTLGPEGRNVVIQKDYSNPVITKDGVTVAKNIKLDDVMENVASDLVKSVAAKTSDDTGDGTTTATILAHSIFTEGNKAIAAGLSPVELKKNIDDIVSYVVDYLKDLSVPCTDTESIKQVGTISANSDSSIGELIADAMDKVGKEGIITVEDGTGLEDELKVVEGMRFERGFLSPYFGGRVWEVDNPYILLVDEKVKFVRDLVPILEAVIQSKRALLLVAEDVEGEALSTLIVNAMQAVFPVCAIKAPGFGTTKTTLLNDIAVSTGATVRSEQLNKPLEETTLKDLGAAKKVIVTSDTTTIIEGAGDPKAIKEHIDALRETINTDHVSRHSDAEHTQRRLALLTGGVAIIKVGAATEVELREKKARVEDALHATKAAVEEGIVPGGGVALVRAKRCLEALPERSEGTNIILKALEAPFRQIIENAGEKPDIILNNVEGIQSSKLKGKEGDNYGYNAATGEYGSMVEMGIIDPTKVVRSALQNAASVSGLMLTTDCIIADSEDKKE